MSPRAKSQLIMVGFLRNLDADVRGVLRFLGVCVLYIIIIICKFNLSLSTTIAGKVPEAMSQEPQVEFGYYSIAIGIGNFKFGIGNLALVLFEIGII